jgi:putative transposase
MTFYRWKRKYAVSGNAELRRLKILEEENRKLDQLVADLALDNAMLQEVIAKSYEAGRQEGPCPLPASRL